MLGENIRKIRKEKHISINKLSKMTGISLGYLSDLENGKSTNPSLEKLNTIADALECPVNSLLPGLHHYQPVKGYYRKGDTRYVDYNGKIYDIKNGIIASRAIFPIDLEKIVNIPIVGYVRAGRPILAQDNIEGYHPTLRNNLCNDKDYFYLRVQGDSMNMEFGEGSLLLIEKCDDVDNGTIAVVLIDGSEATVKKVIKSNDMITLIPMSTNPIYQPQMYDIVKDEIKIIGKVKEATKIY